MFFIYLNQVKIDLFHHLLREFLLTDSCNSLLKSFKQRKLLICRADFLKSISILETHIGQISVPSVLIEYCIKILNLIKFHAILLLTSPTTEPFLFIIILAGTFCYKLKYTSVCFILLIIIHFLS